MPEAPRATYGVDVGGTTVLGVALDSRTQVLAERRLPTPHLPHDPDAVTPEALADALAALVVGLHRDLEGTGANTAPGPGSGQARARRVGLGLAALVDAEGRARFSPHLRGIERVAPSDFSELVSAHLGGAHVGCWNDANCVAEAELTLGRARGAGQAVVVVLGTGIGGAVVVEGAVVRGANGFAGEMGHMVVEPGGRPCPCGGQGCWERYVSAGALTRAGIEAARSGHLSAVLHRAGGDPEQVRAHHVAEAAAAGDPEALQLVNDQAHWLAVGLSNLVAVLDPERVVVGGGLAGLGELLLAPTRRALRAQVVAGAHRLELPVLGAALGARAGAIGAALLARPAERS